MKKQEMQKKWQNVLELIKVLYIVCIVKKKATGSVKLRTNKRGRKPSLSSEDLSNIDKAIQQQPDITIEEIIEKLDLHVTNETVRKAVIKMGYVYKKEISSCF